MPRALRNEEDAKKQDISKFNRVLDAVASTGVRIVYFLRDVLVKAHRAYIMLFCLGCFASRGTLIGSRNRI